MTHDAAGEAAPVDSNQRRTVVYSPETTAAYGNVIDVGMVGNADDVLGALRHLAMMVHCDFTGELREPHTHSGEQMSEHDDINEAIRKTDELARGTARSVLVGQACLSHCWEADDQGIRCCVFCGVTDERDRPMRQKIEQKHVIDSDGTPAGGLTSGTGIYIEWQGGPLGRGDEKNLATGATVESVILAAIGRLQFYQTANNKKFACRENALAITKLEEALMWCEERTRAREEREVEGTRTP